MSSVDIGCPPERVARESAERGEKCAVLVLTVGGIDENCAHALRARKGYSHDDIAWQHRYVDIVTVTPDGRLFIDYARFHEVTPDGVSANVSDGGDADPTLRLKILRNREVSQALNGTSGGAGKGEVIADGPH